MFSKILNRFYYGKSGKSDYTKEDLPQNRGDLFFTTLKVKITALIRLNLIYIIVWLPFIYVLVNAFINYLGASNVFIETIKNMKGEELLLNTQSFKDFQHMLIIKTLLWLIPCISITGPATAGVSYNLRNWARDEHAFLWGDFKDALLANWKQAIGISSISSVMPLLAYIGFYYYGEMAKSYAFFVVFQIIIIIVSLIWWFSLIYAYYLIIGYELKFKHVIKNAILISISRFPQSLALKILSIVPFAICYIISLSFGVHIGLLIFLAYYIVIGFTFSRFIWASYSNACFEKLINSRISGAKTNIGLRPQEYNQINEKIESENDDDASYIYIDKDEI